MSDRYRKRQKLVRGAGGRFCCRYCGTEVEPPRRTFCSAACVHEYRLRRDPIYMRQCVFERDQGVCALCGVDTEALAAAYHRETRGWPWSRRAARLAALGIPAHRETSDWWDADHIVPVVDGGGGCGLDNLRTLCLPCHREVTHALAARRAAERRARRSPPPDAPSPG